MDIHLLIVATGFRVAGWVLGIPSLAALVGLGVGSVGLYQAAVPDPSQPLDVKTYGLVALLAYGAEGLGRILAFLAGLAVWIIAALAVLSVMTLLLAAVLYVTGRGIGHHATWARILAVLISLGFLAASVGAMVILRRDLAVVACLPIGISLYTLWVLCWQFA